MRLLDTDFDAYLSDELCLLKNNIKQFSTLEIAPLAEQIDLNNDFPAHLWKKMGALGVLGITADEQYGGSNAGYLAHVIAMEAISCASASVGLSYGAHSNLCVNQLNRHGSPQQKKQYLPRLMTGEHIGALAMSESNSGSDVISLSLSAKKQGNHYILNGTKMWITNGPDAHVIIVYAKTDPEKGSKGITAFLIENTFPGFSHAQKLDKLGMRGSNTCELVFSDCVVPEENILGHLNEGVSVLMSGLDYERLVLAAGPVGIMQACLNLALPYTQERKQFNRPINQFQFIQGKLADLYTQLNSARSYLYTTALLADKGKLTRQLAASVILYCSENATQAALNTIQILGGNGYTNDYPAGRLLRDAKLYEIGAGTSEIRRMLIGRELSYLISKGSC